MRFSLPTEKPAVLEGLPRLCQNHLAISNIYGGIKIIMANTAFSSAYAAWFARYEVERRRQKKRKGANLPDFPEAPANPENIAAAVDHIGTAKALKTLGVHRSTLARWLAGRAVIPRPCWLLLVMMAEGRLPGMSDDWRDWHFVDDRLCLNGTRLSFSARELAGIPYQESHARALSQRIAQLEKEKAHLLRVGYFEAANDPLTCVS